MTVIECTMYFSITYTYTCTACLEFQMVVIPIPHSHTAHSWMDQVNTGNSILSELTKRELSKKVGHFGFHVTYTAQDGEE